MISLTSLSECSSNRDFALYYFERCGYAIVPIIPGEKRPAIYDYVKHPLTSFEEVDIHYQQRERDGMGIMPAHCKPPLLVVDIDNHPDEMIATGPFRGQHRDGVASFKRLLKEGVLRPDTATSWSPSGGYKQLYIAAPVDDSKDMIAPGIEIICTAHQAVIPPTRHPSGGRHGWVNEHGPDTVKPAPWVLLRAIEEVTL